MLEIVNVVTYLLDSRDCRVLPYNKQPQSYGSQVRAFYLFIMIRERRTI